MPDCDTPPGNNRPHYLSSGGIVSAAGLYISPAIAIADRLTFIHHWVEAGLPVWAWLLIPWVLFIISILGIFEQIRQITESGFISENKKIESLGGILRRRSFEVGLTGFVLIVITACALGWPEARFFTPANQTQQRASLDELVRADPRRWDSG